MQKQVNKYVCWYVHPFWTHASAFEGILVKTRLPSNSLASEGQNLTSKKERLREYFKSIKKNRLQKNKCMFSGMSSVHCPISFP